MNGFNFDTPILIGICKEGKWQRATGKVWLEHNKIYLETGAASWVKIEWAANFDVNSYVLGDAWERTYGDMCWKPIGMPAFHPWYFTVKEPEIVQCIGVKTGPNALCSWRVSANNVSILLDVRCGCKDTQFGGRRILLAELVSLAKQGDTFDIMHEFCKMMCDNPVLSTDPIYGGDDWNAFYGNTSFDKVLQHTKILAECSEGLKNRPYQMIDAGWQLCHNYYYGEEYLGGPYRWCNSNFGSMKAMAEAIKEVDVHPGIWYAPLTTVEYTPDEVFLHRRNTFKYLDPSHPVAQERIVQDLKTFREWGYDMIKHDFSCVDVFGQYGFAWNESVVEGDWTFYEKNKTSAEIIKEYYQRSADAAQGAIISACNTFSHLSAGIFGNYRIGDDTSGMDYFRTVQMGVNTLAFRGAQHMAFYNADPDSVGITTKIPWEKNVEWLRLLSYSGMTTMVGVELSCYNSTVREALTEVFARASQPHETARPIDWMETLTPTRYMTYDGVKEFKWEV